MEDDPEVQDAPVEVAPDETIKTPSAKSNPVSPTSSQNRNKSGQLEDNISDKLSQLEPKGKSISDHVEELADTVIQLSKTITDPHDPVLENNVDKIALMSKILTSEANALRQSIKSLSQDITRTKLALESSSTKQPEDVNFPYHLFLMELIINKIHMKCDCFELDFNNLVISATFLGKQPITLYDTSYGKLNDLSKLNVGKSILFAMTYDKICSIEEFEVLLQLTKQPPCSTCIQKIADTRMDYTGDFIKLREELCKRWAEEKPDDNIVCTTSSPLSKNLFYLSCPNSPTLESIGVIEVSARLSFLGKEITTTFTGPPTPHGTSVLQKEDNGMMMYSCQDVEMDDQGKILLDENLVSRKSAGGRRGSANSSTCGNPMCPSAKPINTGCATQNNNGPANKYDEIFTKMNDNELKIRVPKCTKVERLGKYDRIEELCTCENTPGDSGGDQLQFELPKDLCYPDKSHNTYTSNLKYTYKGCDKTCESKAGKDKRVINVTPTNCPVPVDLEKVLHPQKDVFILKIGKKLETKDKKTDLEIELVTPKIPGDKPSVSNAAQGTASGTKIKKDKKDKKGKKGKGGKKAKGGKKKGKK